MLATLKQSKPKDMLLTSDEVIDLFRFGTFGVDLMRGKNLIQKSG